MCTLADFRLLRAFIGGGSSAGRNTYNHYELHDDISMALGNHWPEQEAYGVHSVSPIVPQPISMAVTHFQHWRRIKSRGEVWGTD
jgi:hypothetical protein